MAERTDRRHFMSSAMLGAAGAGALVSLEEKSLQGAIDRHDHRGEPRRTAYQGEALPTGRIGGLSVSRLLMGGNLIGGYAHSRDLLYVSRLLREYNTESKIFETLEMAERSGINMIQVAPGCVDIVARYRTERGGKIQMMACVDVDQSDPAAVRAQVRELIDQGVETLYTHGERTDRQVMAGNVDAVGRTLDIVRSAGVPGGIGSHSLQTTMASEAHHLNPDYYVKTFHPDNYWSATPAGKREEWCWYHGASDEHDRYHDNIFDLEPKETAAFMKTVAKPWVAFKVMAAGAIPAQVGINHAFRHGADFVIAGMFDFQLAADVEIAVKALKRIKTRERPWRA
jgi:hypothetical protein